MDGPRAPEASEFDRLLHFLNQNLRAGEGWSIRDEYPTALDQNNLGNIRVITENNKILSHAVVKPVMIKTPLGMFKVAGIGSVVTDQNFRSQGLSKQIIEDCVAVAQAQNCDFAILWTNLFEFYRKLGFELAGSEQSYVINRELPVPSTDLKFVKGNKVDPEALLRVYSQHTVSSVRSFDEVRKYLQIPNSNVYTAWGADGQLKAYAAEGKGADLQGYIHEWGGQLSNFLPLLNHIYKDQKKQITLIAPRHSENLHLKLKSFGVQEIPGYLGMIKILNPQVLFGKILRSIRADQGHEDFVFEKRQDGYYIGTQSKMFKTDSEADIIRLIFGPYKPSAIHSFDPPLLALLEKTLPIPMWIWGWDSV
ncbi:MAG: GNAT family N-acetyltransferase [Bdellovibrionales bacterium]